MKRVLLVSVLITCFFVGSVRGNDCEDSTPFKSAPAHWTVVVYIAADNNLASYALYNIKDMSAGLAATSGVNVLVQWDKPEDRKIWRYKITPGGKTDVGSLPLEMGYNPAQEVFNALQWACRNYPAEHYALILWDHGSGIEDFYPGSRSMFDTSVWSLLELQASDRGILYDDSQKTCLTNQGLTSALAAIKGLLKKNLDVLAMDACLMAMVEVTYQMKGLVDIFVGSEQTIPGEGFPYSYFLRPLSLDPSMSPLQLARTIVSSYGAFYTSEVAVSDHTLSVIDVSAIEAVKQNIDQFITAVGACSKIDAARTKSMIIAARKKALSFDMPEYIDLYSLYANVLKQGKVASPKSSFILEKNGKKVKQKVNQPTKNYQVALNALNAVVQDGLTKISKVVVQEVTGPTYAGAKGISLYYPRTGALHASYSKTLFAKNTTWSKFIQQYR